MSLVYSPPQEEILFILNDVVGIQDIFELQRFAHADTELAAAIVSEAARLAKDVISPINQQGDELGCQLVDGAVRVPEVFRQAYKSYVDGGWTGLELAEQYHGQELPGILGAAVSEMTNGASIAFCMLPCMLRAASIVLINSADEWLKDKVVPELVAGSWGATIAITEANAGSDVGRIKTKAVKQTDGSYRLTGSKVFITCADHNYTEQIVHMVLARTDDLGAGTAGLSLFVVPKIDFDNAGKPNGLSIGRLEHKMGLKASPTCVLNLEQAKGYRVGEENKGLASLFPMMNSMRLEVAAQAVGVASAATQRAIDYAQERQQGGKVDAGIVQHADIRRHLLRMRAYTEAMRALLYQVAKDLDLSEYAVSDQSRQQSLYFAEFMLPVCKAWMSDKAFLICSEAMQVYGGHGYVSDDGIEQYVRDSRVLGIYEGTNGIQALDLVMRKLLKFEGKGYRELLARMNEDIDRAQTNESCKTLVTAVQSAAQLFARCSDWLMVECDHSIRNVEAAASSYLQLTGYVAGAWMWLRMAEAASSDEMPLHRAKRHTAAFYMEHLLPVIKVLEQQIKSGADLIDAVDDDSLCYLR